MLEIPVGSRAEGLQVTTALSFVPRGSGHQGRGVRTPRGQASPPPALRPRRSRRPKWGSFWAGRGRSEPGQVRTFARGTPARPRVAADGTALGRGLREAGGERWTPCVPSPKPGQRPHGPPRND